MNYSKLSNEELFIFHQAGDKQAFEALYTNNTKLAWFIANRYYSSGIDMDDLYIEAMIGFSKSLKKYNPESNVKLSSYAVRCMTNEILMLIRSNKKQPSEVYSLQEIVTCRDGDTDICYEDILTDEVAIDEELMFREDIKVVNEAISNLEPREKQIMTLRYIKNLNQTEAAKIVGISQSVLSRREKKILTGLKKTVVI